MKKIAVFLTVLGLMLFKVLTPSQAHADEWSHTEEHKFSEAASIKIVGPDKFKASLDGKEDSLPTIFKVPNEDKYHTITVTSPDGKTWTQKIEVKVNRQTIVTVKYQAATPTPTTAKLPRHIGQITNTCKQALRVEIMDGADSVGDMTIGGKKMRQMELRKGTYQVRVFQNNGGAWVYKLTVDVEVTKDGWIVNLCR